MRFFGIGLLLLAVGCGGDPSPSDDAVAAMNAGLREMENGRAEPAIRHFQEALLEAPEWDGARVNLLVARMHAGLLDPTRIEWSDSEGPENPRKLFLSGVCWRRLGEPGRAISDLRRLTALEPDDADSWCWLGLALKDAGRDDEAKVAFERALEHDGSLVAAKSALAVLRGEPLREIDGRPIGGAYVFWGRFGRAIRRFPGIDTEPPPGDRWLVVDLVPGTPPGTMEGMRNDPFELHDCRMEARAGRHVVERAFSPIAPEYRLDLGGLETIDYLRIEWPSGRLTAHGPLDTNQTVTIRESEQ